VHAVRDRSNIGLVHANSGRNFLAEPTIEDSHVGQILLGDRHLAPQRKAPKRCYGPRDLRPSGGHAFCVCPVAAKDASLAMKEAFPGSPQCAEPLIIRERMAILEIIGRELVCRIPLIRKDGQSRDTPCFVDKQIEEAIQLA